MMVPGSASAVRTLAAERARLLRGVKERITGDRAGLGLPIATLGRAAVELIDEMDRTEPSPAIDPAEAAAGPLESVVRAFDLRDFELDVLLVAVLAEIDWRFQRLLGYLQDNPSLTRPAIGLALALASGSSDGPTVFDLCEGPLVRDGLVTIEGDGPLAGRLLRPTDGVVERLAGASGGGAAVLPDARLIDGLVLGDEAEAIRRWARTAAQPLLLCGSRGSGRRTLGRAAAGLAGMRLIAIDLAHDAQSALLARREARWHDAALLIEADDVDDVRTWRTLWRALDGIERPALVILQAQQIEQAAAACPVEPVVVQLGARTPDTRRRLWRSLAPPALDDPDVDALAARFAFTPKRIARVVSRARSETHPESPSRAALVRAAREIGRASMGPLAERLPLPFTRRDLIVTDRVRAELDLCAAWLRHERRVQEEWGLGGRIGRGRGLTALFAGEPGTGKTMAAQVLAAELELDLYRIDLSRVLDKYIGETEKNLSRLFDEATSSGAILFFDEGDALFGKRTETQDAHDRYANVEIAYLLQRMEEHEGVTMVATNRLRDVDEAFVRRFHVLADFSLPEAADRLEIWQCMFAPPVECDPELRLDVVARELQLSGGQIRNAAIAAAYLAAADGTRICAHHLERSLRRELRRQGRVFDERISRTLGALARR